MGAFRLMTTQLSHTDASARISTVDIGPLDDILNLWFFGMMFYTIPRANMQQVPDGYICKLEDPTYGSVIVTHDQAYTLETYIHTDSDRKELLRARFLDLNKLHDLVPYEEVGDLLDRSSDPGSERTPERVAHYESLHPASSSGLVFATNSGRRDSAPSCTFVLRLLLGRVSSPA